MNWFSTDNISKLGGFFLAITRERIIFLMHFVTITSLLLLSFSHVVYAQNSNIGGSRVVVLKETQNKTIISLKEAFSEALAHHHRLQIANNLLQRWRVENLIRLGALLPKLRLGSSYTRNIPEVETTLSQDGETQELSRHVANLLRKSGEETSAEELERRADLMLRRQPDSKIVLSPKDVFDAKLTLEIPLFNGPDIARMLSTGENVLLQEARVREEEANTIFSTAKAYFGALHVRNILLVREQAEVAAQESYLKAQAERKRGKIMEKDYLHAQASVLQREAERNRAQLDYRNAIAELGLLLGRNTEFQIDDLDQMFFEPLNADTDRLVEVAITNRPDLKAERQALRVIENERFGHFLQFLPTLTLQGDAKYSSNDKSMMRENFTYAISLNASIALFDGGTSISQLRQTTLRRQESEIRLRQLKLEIDASIRGRKERLLQLTFSQRAADILSKAAAESLHVASARLRRGMIELQDYLEISDRKLDADIAFKKSQSDLNEEKLALIFEAGLLTPQFVQ